MTTKRRLIVVRQSPVDDVHFLCDVIDEDVLGLDVAMHDTLAVRVVKTLFSQHHTHHERLESYKSSSAADSRRGSGKTPRNHTAKQRTL